jgi:hypothetical protein
MSNILDQIINQRNVDRIDNLLADWDSPGLTEEIVMAFESMDYERQYNLLLQYFVSDDDAERATVGHYYSDSPGTWESPRPDHQKAQCLQILFKNLRQELVEMEAEKSPRLPTKEEYQSINAKRLKIREGLYKRATNEELIARLVTLGEKISDEFIQRIESLARDMSLPEIRYAQVKLRLEAAFRNKTIGKQKDENERTFRELVNIGDTIRYRFNRQARTGEVVNVNEKSLTVMVGGVAKYLKYGNILEILVEAPQ